MAMTQRQRWLAAAKRTVKAVIEEAQAQQATLENGGVPDGPGLSVGAVKYDQAITVLNTLDLAASRGEIPGPEEPDYAQVPEAVREDLRLLVPFVREAMNRLGMVTSGDSPLDRLTRIAGFPPAEPA